MQRDEETAELVEQLRSGGDPEALAAARDRMVHLHMDVARSLARHYRNRGIADEDLEQAALLGLVTASRGFDADKGDSFLSYAVPCIRGALRRHFRDRGWMVKPPRRLQDLHYDIAKAVGVLEQSEGRSPRPSEIAEQLGVRVDDVVEALSTDWCFTPPSLDAPLAGSTSLTLGECLPVPDSEFAAAEARATLAPALRRLGARDRLILTMRFAEQCSQQEIADEIGVTQMQVSRLLVRIMRDLRDLLSAPSGEGAHCGGRLRQTQVDGRRRGGQRPAVPRRAVDSRAGVRSAAVRSQV